MKLKCKFCLPLKNWCLFCDSAFFSHYIVLRSSDFLVTGTFFVGRFEVCYSLVLLNKVQLCSVIKVLLNQSVAVLCFVFRRKSATQFFSNVHVCFALLYRIAVQFVFFVCFNFNNIQCFSVKKKVSDRAERKFFSSTVFGQWIWMTMDDTAWQWIGNISLLTWGLIWACACSHAAWCRILGFLLLLYFHYLNWPILKTFEHYVNIPWTKFFSVNFHQRCFNVDLWLKMKIEPTYIYWRCLNVGKQHWNKVNRITSIQRRRWSNVISKLKFDWKWKLSRRIFIDVVSTLTKQPWINVKIITSIQCWWLNVFST